MAATYITFFYHTRGKFVKDNRGVLSYVNGKVDSVPPIDVDLVTYFDLFETVKGFGYCQISNINWELTDHPRPEPPALKRPIGRPKKHRRKDPISEEVVGSLHKVKKRYEVTCNKCGDTGHYEKTCKGPTQQGYKPRKPRKKKATTEATTVGGSSTQEFQGLDTPDSAPEPPAVRPPPMRPRAPTSLYSTPPPFTPSPTSAVGMQSIRPPAPPVRPFIPPRAAHNEVNSGTARMQFQFMPTPGFRSPPPPPPPHA